MDLVVKDVGDLFINLGGERDSQEKVIAEIKTFVNELKTRFQSRIIKQSGQILFGEFIIKILMNNSVNSLKY